MNDYKSLTISLILEKFDLIKEEKANEKRLLLKESLEGKKLCLFGTGHLGHRAYLLLKTLGYKVEYFCDNNSMKWDQIIIDDILCISPERLSELGNTFVVISLGDVDKVYNQLVKMGIKDTCKHLCEYFSLNQNEIFSFNKQKIINNLYVLFDILADDQSKKIIYWKMKALLSTKEELKDISYSEIFSEQIYIPGDIIEIDNNAVIVDCGAFDGDTLEYISSNLGIDGFKNYLCFELNKDNYQKLRERVNNHLNAIADKVELYNFGVSDKKEKILYNNDSNASKKTYAGTIEGLLCTLDAFLEARKIDYIKMDIEGSELLALKGAKRLIERNKPQLAICLYHRITDLWNVPFLLHEFCSEYKIYIRHHSLMQNETVCYAVIP